MGKKALCLIFALIFSINSFAAVVSDNDGSAFITKAEFDSLKNNFQSQVDSYNVNVDNKIDDAIASYLAGIKLDKTTKIKTIHSDWKNIEFINYEIKPSFIVPNYTWTVTASWFSTCSSYDKKISVIGGYKKYERNWGDNEYNIRPLASIISGKESDYSNSTFSGCIVAWNGCASRWVESWSFNKYGYGNCYNMTGNTNYRVYMPHPFTFGSLGYIKNKTINQLLPIKPRFQDNAEGSWKIAPRNSGNNRADLDYTYYDGYFGFNVVLDTLNNGSKYCHNHIITNESGTGFWLSNQNFTNTLNSCNYQTVTDANVGGVTGATTFIQGERLTYNNSDGGGATSYTGGYMGNVAWDYDNSKIPMVGLLPRRYSADEIFQENYSMNNAGDFVQRDITWDETTITDVVPLTLYNGLEVCISVKDKTYEWELEFETVDLTDSSGTRTNQNEVDIYLSLVPFGNGTTTSANIKWPVGNVLEDHVTTTNRKAKFKWAVDDEKTMVYMKCVPHFKSTDTGTESYLIRLNSDKSGEISVTTTTTT